MFAVEVRDHVMIAHSLPDPAFGPAQGLHGATYVIDVAFFRETLTAESVVVDIGLAAEALKEIVSRLNYANLDTLPEFAGKLTTTEFLAHYVYECLREACHSGGLGPAGVGLSALRVTLHESHVARAWFEGPVA